MLLPPSNSHYTISTLLYEVILPIYSLHQALHFHLFQKKIYFFAIKVNVHTKRVLQIAAGLSVCLSHMLI